MEKLPFVPPEPDLKPAFDMFDTDKKGYLKKEEFSKLCDHLINVLKLDKYAVRGMARDLEKLKDEIDYASLSAAWKKQSLVKSTAEIDSPAVKLVLLLKEIKALEPVDKSLKNDVDWCLEKLVFGKIYETEFEKGTFVGPSKRLSEMLPWLSQYSTPRITLEDIEAYKKEKALAEASQKEKLKRRSVVLDDLISEINKHTELISTIETPSFSPFEFLKVFDRKKVLPLIAYHIFHAHDAFSVIDEVTFEGFIQKIRSGYNSENLFHNDLHAADVLQMCHYMLTYGGVKEVLQLDTQDVAAFLVAAVIHDYKHPAWTNGYLQNIGHDLALLYNDQSILENYHLSQAFEVIFKEKGCNIFDKKSTEELKLIRKRIIECVLSTDMAKHFEIVNGMQSLISTHDIIKGANNDKIVNKKTPLAEFESKQRILNACLHATDVGNPTRPFEIAQEWTKRVMEEFWRQGDLEKERKLPVTFLCDRNTTDLPASQVGFITAIVKPLFEKLAQIFPKLTIMVENIEKTEQEWRKRLPQQKEAKS